MLLMPHLSRYVKELSSQLQDAAPTLTNGATAAPSEGSSGGAAGAGAGGAVGTPAQGGDQTAPASPELEKLVKDLVRGTCAHTHTRTHTRAGKLPVRRQRTMTVDTRAHWPQGVCRLLLYVVDAFVACMTRLACTAKMQQQRNALPRPTLARARTHTHAHTHHCTTGQRHTRVWPRAKATVVPCVADGVLSYVINVSQSLMIMRLGVVKPLETRKFIVVSRQYLGSSEAEVSELWRNVMVSQGVGYTHTHTHTHRERSRKEQTRT